ncbi:Kelch repeat-containing protein [Sphingobacterium thalpophilum]|uniref:Kelch repeat-containing protein n=1 Tax=Sphingobacterium thalpophilum TaxID=259 RepID=UPI0024A74888|nr:hypothetical protein [Sphingobacterium thalpophilum]
MNKKNWLLVLSAFVVTVTTFSSCKKSDDTEDEKSTEWFQKAAYKGPQTSAAASFVIKNIAYVTTGQSNNAGSKPIHLKTTYAYDPASNSWSEKDPLADDAERSGRRNAIAFTIGDFGYVGGGNDGSNYLQDFYKFDPAAERGKQWTRIADLPIPLASAIAFSIDGKAYVGTGETTVNNGVTFTNQFFKYDPSANKWEAINDAPFTAKRKGAFVFMINNVAYIGGGVSNSSNPKDFYKFDGSKWTQLADISRNDGTYNYDLTRSGAVAFALNGNGFLVGGLKGSIAINSVAKYNVSGDYWTTDNTNFGGTARYDAVGYAIGATGYVTTGLNGSTRFDDNWSFTPIY